MVLTLALALSGVKQAENLARPFSSLGATLTRLPSIHPPSTRRHHRIGPGMCARDLNHALRGVHADDGLGVGESCGAFGEDSPAASDVEVA